MNQYEEVRVTVWKKADAKAPYPLHSIRTLHIRADCRGSLVRDVPTAGESLDPYVSWKIRNGGVTKAIYSKTEAEALIAHVQLAKELNAEIGGSILMKPDGGAYLAGPGGTLVEDTMNLRVDGEEGVEDEKE